MEPQLERDGEIAYLTDADGVRYRVHDVLYRKHRKHVLPLESSRANMRYFVGEGGATRAYSFKKLESRVLTPEGVAAQLSGAGFVAVTSRDHGALRPT